MCGIVGAASLFLAPGEISTFEDLMIVSNLRGKQGSGVIIVKDKGTKVHSVRSIRSGAEVTNMEKYLEHTKTNVQVLVGHTRHPTRGGVDIANVHPHAVPGHLSGVHNGTMNKVADKAIPDGESDSRLLYADIAERGIKTALKEASGAYCLVFVDYTTGKLNFIRNSQRPLWFAKVNWKNGGRTLYWASERRFLELVLDRKSTKAEYVELPTNELWTLPVDMTADNFEVEKSIVPFAGTVYRNNQYMGGGADHWYDSVPFSGGKPAKGGTSSLVSLPSTTQPESFPKTHNNPPSTVNDVKQTFVMRNGILVRKGQDESKQVTLPRDSHSTAVQSEGTKADVASDTKGSVSQDLVKQRAASSPQVRDNRGRFTPVVVPTSTQQVSLPATEEEAKRLAEVDAAFDALMARRYPDNDATLDCDRPAEEPVTLDEMFNNAFKEKKIEYVETLKGNYVRADKVEEILLKHGCEWCGESAFKSDKVSWMTGENFLCENCQLDVGALTHMYDYFPFSPIMEDWKNGRLPGLGKPSWIDNENQTVRSIQ